MQFQTLLNASSETLADVADGRHAPVKHFYIKRAPLQPGYDVHLQQGERKFCVDTDFSRLFRRLTLRSLDTHPYDMPLCYMCWGSRKIHIGFVNLDQIQGNHWEEMQKKRKNIKDLRWENLGEEKYEWGEHLLCTRKRPWPTRHQHYKLVDQTTTKVMAEFQCDKDLYMGGVLTIKNVDEYPESFDLKVLMAFMAIYEKERGGTHHTVYRFLKGNIICSFYYKMLQFGIRCIGVMPWRGLDPAKVQETCAEA